MIICSNNFLGNALAVLITITIAIWFYYKWVFNYWKRKGLPFLQPSIPFGNVNKMLMAKLNMGQQFEEIYNELKGKGHKHGGVYLGLSPIYVAINPELVKHILQIDFQHFVNHGFYVDEKNDPLNSHLFNLEDTKWKNLRAKLTPTFTSGKMKMMFPILVECGLQLREIADEAAKNGVALEFKDVLARFSTDVIGTCAFGIECNSLKNPDATFRKHGKEILKSSYIENFKGLCTLLFPHWLLSFIKIKITKPKVEKFFMNVVKETVNFREVNNIYRKDFMHLLIQLKNLGRVEDNGKIKENKDNAIQTMTIEEVAAQAYIFFIAGFETSSTTMSFALYELSLNPEIQGLLRDEIKTVLGKYNGQITYEAIMEMTYMDKVIYETLRKYPPVPLLNRACSKDYVVPNSSIFLQKGSRVFIPILGIQHDPEFYPNPEKFDPERFSEENKIKRPPFTWLPFGEGPRICIGLRFGMMQTKIGLTVLIKDFNITLNNKTKVPLEFDAKSFLTTTNGGIWLNVKKIDV